MNKIKKVFSFLGMLILGVVLTPGFTLADAAVADPDVKSAFDTLMTNVKPTLIYVIAAIAGVVVTIILFKAAIKWLGKVGKG